MRVMLLARVALSLVCISIAATHTCTDAGSCLLDQDEMNLMQVKSSAMLGSERSHQPVEMLSAGDLTAAERIAARNRLMAEEAAAEAAVNKAAAEQEVAETTLGNAAAAKAAAVQRLEKAVAVEAAAAQASATQAQEKEVAVKAAVAKLTLGSAPTAMTQAYYTAPTVATQAAAPMQLYGNAPVQQAPTPMQAQTGGWWDPKNGDGDTGGGGWWNPKKGIAGGIAGSLNNIFQKYLPPGIIQPFESKTDAATGGTSIQQKELPVQTNAVAAAQQAWGATAAGADVQPGADPSDGASWGGMGGIAGSLNNIFQKYIPPGIVAPFSQDGQTITGR